MFTPTRTALLLLIVTAILYAPTWAFPFVYEDQNDLETLYRPFEVSDLWLKPARVLTVLTFAVTPMHAGVQHLVNVGVHLVNVALLFTLSVSVMPMWPAAIIAAGFAWHPIQVEAVAYVSSRSDLLATTGVLLALCAASAGRWLSALLASACAVAGKETAIVAFALVPLWGWYRQTRPPVWVVTLWSVLAIIAASYFIARYPLQLSVLAMGQTLISLADLLARVVVPVGLTIDPDWRWSQPMQVAGASLLVFVPGLLASMRAPLAFAALWVLVCIAPRLVVPLTEGLHAHHLYLPLVGLALGGGASLTKTGAFSWQ